MDWEHVGDIVATAGQQLWSFVSVALMVYYGGESAKRLADRKGWRASHKDEASVFDALLPVMPVVAGAIFMQLPFPVIEAIDGLDKSDGFAVEAVARMGWGALAGATCGQVFEMIQALLRFARRRLGLSEPPPVIAKATETVTETTKETVTEIEIMGKPEPKVVDTKSEPEPSRDESGEKAP